MDLSNIVIPGSEGQGHVVVQAIKDLKVLVDAGEQKSEEMCAKCAEIGSECAKGLAERVLATQNGAYDVLVKCFEVGEDHSEVQVRVMGALTHLLDGNPDPLEQNGLKVR